MLWGCHWLPIGPRSQYQGAEYLIAGGVRSLGCNPFAIVHHQTSGQNAPRGNQVIQMSTCAQHGLQPLLWFSARGGQPRGAHPSREWFACWLREGPQSSMNPTVCAHPLRVRAGVSLLHPLTNTSRQLPTPGSLSNAASACRSAPNCRPTSERPPSQPARRARIIAQQPLTSGSFLVCKQESAIAQQPPITAQQQSITAQQQPITAQQPPCLLHHTPDPLLRTALRVWARISGWEPSEHHHPSVAFWRSPLCARPMLNACAG